MGSTARQPHQIRNPTLTTKRGQRSKNQIKRCGGINRKTLAVDTNIWNKCYHYFLKPEEWQRGTREASKTRVKPRKKPARRAEHYIRTQGLDIGHRGNAIRRQSVTQGCDRRVNREGLHGQRGCQPKGVDCSWNRAKGQNQEEEEEGQTEEPWKLSVTVCVSD